VAKQQPNGLLNRSASDHTGILLRGDVKLLESRDHAHGKARNKKKVTSEDVAEAPVHSMQILCHELLCGRRLGHVLFKQIR
jgi:hypothetical protein